MTVILSAKQIAVHSSDVTKWDGHEAAAYIGGDSISMLDFLRLPDTEIRAFRDRTIRVDASDRWSIVLGDGLIPKRIAKPLRKACIAHVAPHVLRRNCCDDHHWEAAKREFGEGKGTVAFEGNWSPSLWFSLSRCLSTLSRMTERVDAEYSDYETERQWQIDKLISLLEGDK